MERGEIAKAGAAPAALAFVLRRLSPLVVLLLVPVPPPLRVGVLRVWSGAADQRQAVAWSWNLFPIP